MSETARPGQGREWYVYGATPSIEAQFSMDDGSGADPTVLVEPTTDGVSESPAGSGSYVVLYTAPEGNIGDQYRLRLLDEDGNVLAEESLLLTSRGFSEGTTTDWAPGVDEIASEAAARTRDTFGNVGAFSTDTNPTEAQVTDLIGRSVWDVTAKIGRLEDCSAANIDDLRAAAKDMVILRTIIRIERSYFPEQISADASIYKALTAEWDEGMKTLVEAVAESCDGGDGESVAGDGGASGPVYAFPESPCWGTAAW